MFRKIYKKIDNTLICLINYNDVIDARSKFEEGERKRVDLFDEAIFTLDGEICIHTFEERRRLRIKEYKALKELIESLKVWNRFNILLLSLLCFKGDLSPVNFTKIKTAWGLLDYYNGKVENERAYCEG